MRKAAFAIPGDVSALTGGYKYDSKLICGLRNSGWTISLLQLGGSFPNPTREDLSDAARQLATAGDQPIVVDGLALGAFDPEVMRSIRSPIVALIHHPLALETGQSSAEQTRFLKSERRNLRQVSHVLVPSPHVAKVLVSDYEVDAARITIAKPGTDHSRWPAAKVDPPLILSVGIQVPRKGHDILIKALARITPLSWKAVIAGEAIDANHATELAHLVTELGLDERVTLAGRVSDKDLSKLYAQSSVFALATRYEGYGLVFDEAMFHGLPIVTCKAGAVSDTVATNAGIIVLPEDPSSFADALAKTLSDDRYRAQMASASAQAGAALPTWAGTVKLVDTVLRQVTLTSASKG